MSNLQYQGNELELFFKAKKWKSYFSSFLKPFVRGRVLEIGAGLGANIAYLINAEVKSWLAVEPDAALLERLPDKAAHIHIARKRGTLTDIPAGEFFDAILYIDVLEHIEDDRAELQRAESLLLPQGAIVVLAPAHQSLFSRFDREVGHFRRYDRGMLADIRPSGCRLEKIFYLDSLGCLCSLMNRFFLTQSYPSSRQILFWDKAIVPWSKIIDPLLGFRLGKTVAAVYLKADMTENK